MPRPRPSISASKQTLPLQVASLQAKVIVHRPGGISLKRLIKAGTSSLDSLGKPRVRREALDLTFVLYSHATRCSCRIKRIVSLLDKKTKEKVVVEDEPQLLSVNDLGVIEIEPLPGCPLYLEEHASASPIGCLGRLLLFESAPREKHVKLIAAFGVVTSVTWKQVELQPGSLLRRSGVAASASSGA